jgi:uncharacterized membrane protein
MFKQKENENIEITMEKTGKCEITGKVLPVSDLVGVGSIRPQIMLLIKEAYPEWNSEKGMVSLEILNKFRDQYVQTLLREEKGELNKLDMDVMESIRNRETLSVNHVEEFNEKLTFGQRVADKMAIFGGSWKFIIIFCIILFTWIGVNAFILVKKPFDPFPFILLNLILSCLAAIQAPVIMMSQNRQEAKDRSRSQNDYQVNLKAEIEIRQLHEKIDHILISQGQHLFEIQQIQVELMEQILKK